MDGVKTFLAASLQGICVFSEFLLFFTAFQCNCDLIECGAVFAVFLLVLVLRFSLVAVVQVGSNACQCDIGVESVGEDEDEFDFEVLNEIHESHYYFISEFFPLVVELLTG